MNREKNSIYFILYSIIMMLLLIGVLVMNSENNENRALLSFGDIEITSIKSIIELPKIIDDIMIDNFPMKSQAVKLSSFISYRFLNTLINDRVLLGKDGWMFYTIPGENPIDKYTGKELFSKIELEAILSKVEKVKGICDKSSTKLVIMIAPAKMTVYSEKLPNKIVKVNDITKTDQFYTMLKSNTDIIALDVRDELIKGKSENQLYWATDTHWNQYGAYLAYEKFMKILKIDKFVSLEDWQKEEILYAGDISKNILGLGKMVTEKTDVFINLSPNYIYFDDNYKDDGMRVAKNINEDLPSLLFIHDSFGDAMLPMINEMFYNVCDVVPSMAVPLDYSFINKFETDILFIEITERAINNINALFDVIIESELIYND